MPFPKTKPMTPNALNFDLQISPDGDGYRAEVVASPSGTPTARFDLPSLAVVRICHEQG